MNDEVKHFPVRYSLFLVHYSHPLFIIQKLPIIVHKIATP